MLIAQAIPTAPTPTTLILLWAWLCSCLWTLWMSWSLRDMVHCCKESNRLFLQAAELLLTPEYLYQARQALFWDKKMDVNHMLKHLAALPVRSETTGKLNHQWQCTERAHYCFPSNPEGSLRTTDDPAGWHCRSISTAFSVTTRLALRHRKPF